MEQGANDKKPLSGFRAPSSPVELVEEIIRIGLVRRASDIHIEPREHKTMVRMRVDGLIKPVLELPKSVHEPTVSRLKILAGLRTDIRQSSQDGRFRLKRTSKSETAVEKSDFDIRISLVPTYYGEKVVLRILSRSPKKYSFDSLGFIGRNEEQILKSLSTSSGMILAVGPTGSGKTTTLYSMLEVLTEKDVSIVTLEDPIEYVIENTTQIPIQTKSGFTFSEALRSVVRQDPDIIMVGEIRDSLTAKLAIQSALTGHLLLSTLHTNSAAAAAPRLIDMGIEPYLVASTVRLVIAQRLVRKLCSSCKIARQILPKEKEVIIEALSRNNSGGSAKKAGTIDIEKLYESKGCDFCGGGFNGRVSICELLVITDEIRELIESKASSATIAECMFKNGIPDMLGDGIEKVKQGHTTLAEVLRVISD